jgi:hypothetical protein
MGGPAMSSTVARGVGPPAVRYVLVGIAALYFTGLMKRVPQLGGLHAVAFFTEATCLFPEAATYVIEFRLETWSCRDAAWQASDPRPLFPIEADSKESRFQRLGHFYQRHKQVMSSLDEWIVERLGSRGERVGGIRVVKVLRPIPAPGAPIPRHEHRPLDPIPVDQRRDMYVTPAIDRRNRCDG